MVEGSEIKARPTAPYSALLSVRAFFVHVLAPGVRTDARTIELGRDLGGAYHNLVYDTPA